MSSAVIGVALAVTAWFALLAVQSHATDSATRIIDSPRPTAAQARHARGLLDTASVLNPDQSIVLLRSQLAAARGQTALARRLAADATRSEPDNPDAWLQLTRVSAPAPAAVALQHLARLAPNITGQS
jgi:hypothetical protein